MAGMAGMAGMARAVVVVVVGGGGGVQLVIMGSNPSWREDMTAAASTHFKLAVLPNA